MRRIEWFVVFSVVFITVVFVAMPTPPMLYFGLMYSLVFWISRDRIKERCIKFDSLTLLGILLVVISPIFILFKWGDDPSPSTFQALVFLGSSLIFFEARTIVFPSLILLLEIILAILTRTKLGVDALTWLSTLFVDLTSYLVRGLIDLFNVPIVMKGNVAVVRNSVVVIGSGCSGLDAFILYLLAAALLALLRKSDRREATLLLLGALGIIPLNALRIFTLLVIGYHSGISFLELFHSHLGDLMFVVYVFGYWWWIIHFRRKEREKISAAPE